MKTMTIEEIQVAYFDWLTELTVHPQYDHFNVSYIEMLSRLHEIEFTIPNKHCTMDLNRVVDAMDLRNDYVLYLAGQDIYIPIGSSVFSKKPSVLEVLTALASRCERDIMYDADKGPRTWKWFWMMMENLGLDHFNDDMILNLPNSITIIDDIVRKFLDRTFEPTGEGSLFPLESSPMIDQRSLDIWTQMTRFLSERGVT